MTDDAADPADLANLCLLEIEGLVQIVRSIAAVKIEDAAGRAVNSMLLRIERLPELAALCNIEADPGRLLEISREIHGAAPRCLKRVGYE